MLRLPPANQVIMTFIVGLLFGLIPVSGQNTITQLETGKSMARDLKGSEQHLYQITLPAETYLNLTIKYQGQITSISLNDPQGQPLLERGGGTETLGEAEVAVIAPTMGNYQLIVRGRGTAKDTGTYTLEVKVLHAATEQDRQYTRAHRLTEEGNSLNILRTAEARRQALAKFREALSLWRASGELRQEFEALRLIADTHYVLGEFRPAMEAAQEMLTKARTARLKDLELKSLKYVGLLQNSLNDYQASRKTLEQALVLSRELHERLEERAILSGLGIAVAALGQRHLAIGYYQEALKIAREIGDRSGEATMLRNLAVRYEGIGEPDQAVAYFQQALALRRELGLRDAEATTLLDLSRMQMRLGEFQQSLELAGQSRTLLRAAGRKDDEAFTLEHLGQVHIEMREFELALDAVNQALVIYRGNENRKQAANCLRLLSSIHRGRGDATEAHNLLDQALTLHRSLGMPAELMTDLLYLGIEYAGQGEPRQALVHFSESLVLSREVNSPQGEALALLHTSRAHRALGETDKARELLQQALTLSRTIKHRLLEAEAEHDLAQIALHQKRYNEAQTQIETALDIIENSRSRMVNPATRADYRSSKQSYYEIYIEALLRQREQGGDERLTAQALETVERARARSLLELLTEAQTDIRQGVNPELLSREHILQQRLSAKAELMQRLGTQKNGQEQAKLLEAEIVTLTAELREAESRIRVASPAYAALTQPQPLKLAEIQQQVLDRDTVLLEYALGTERSYVFTVTPTTLKVFTLSKRTDIETAARLFQERLTRRSKPPVFHSLAAKQQWLAQLDRETILAADALSQLVLQPLAAELASKRLLIVPDGALHYVPFAALPSPVVSGRWLAVGKKEAANRLLTTDQRPPLIVDHELLTLPSASTLALLRREMANRQPAAKTIVVLADPVFEKADERLQIARTPASKLSQVSLSTELQRAVAETTEGDATGNIVPASFFRLPYTRTEANAILAVAPKATTKVVLDFAVNRDAAINGDLGQYRYVHFATHGLLNSVHPELSGLVLSLVDVQGNTQNGFLRTMDVFNLKLNAELVVLSGCRTGLGKDIHGEGLVGLTRGFMYAGSRRVMASVWNVNDNATAELMQHFYRGMLGAKKMSPTAALRAAQIEMWNDKKWKAPYYWAAFTLQGEW